MSRFPFSLTHSSYSFHNFSSFSRFTNRPLFFSTQLHPPQKKLKITQKSAFSILRYDILSNNWVVFSTGRSERPNQYSKAIRQEKPIPEYLDICPFCPGNEESTGPSSLSFHTRTNLPENWENDRETHIECMEPHEHLDHQPFRQDWLLRVVKNKYPVVHASTLHHPDLPDLQNPLRSEQQLFLRAHRLKEEVPASGHHEVLIETQKHNLYDRKVFESHHESELSVYLLLKAFRMRSLSLTRDDPKIKQILLFKNKGKTAGASLVHPHAQLVALPIVPANVKVRVEQSYHYYQKYGSCILCDTALVETLSSPTARSSSSLAPDPSLMIEENEHFISIVPYAAYSPFQCWIVPKKHSHLFYDIDELELLSLSKILWSVLLRLDIALSSPDFNLVIHSAPNTTSFDSPVDTSRLKTYCHWYIEIHPRLSAGALAGFELGSGIYSNSSLPESDAEYLRQDQFSPIQNNENEKE